MTLGPPPAAPPPQVVVPGAGWVDVASRAIVQVGFPVVVAAVLLWFLLTRFQANMDAIVARMANNTQVVTTLIEQERGSFEELKRQSIDISEQTRLLRQIEDDAGKLTEVRAQELEIIRGVARQQMERKQ
jgi:hypothetical protein